MFTRVTPRTDSQLSNDDVANLILDDAINKLAQLTDLDKEQAYALLTKQIKSQINVEESAKLATPILEVKESQFISSLFN